MPDLAGRRGPRALAIAAAIAEDVAAGRLKPGDRLPPQRDLAYALAVSPDTVMRAYAEAARRGLASGAVGRGTFVRLPPPPPSDVGSMARPAGGGPIDFARNLPCVGTAGDLLAGTLATLAGQGPLAALLDHQGPKDGVAHRQAGAVWIGRLGLDAEAERVALCNGAQQGIFVTLMALLRPGDVLLTDALTYAPVKAMARHLALRIVALPSDEDGMTPDGIEAACKRWAPKALYCTPTLHTPTAVTMSDDRRRRIAALAQRHGVVVIEDDVFGFLPPQRPPPIAAFAPDTTILITSVSKSLAPGLRVGFIHAPERWMPAIRAAIALSSWMPPPLMAEIVTRWIGDGTAAQLTTAQRAHAARRQAMAQAILPGQAGAIAHGLHLWLRMPEHWSGDAFVMAAARAGVQLQPASAFAVDETKPPAAIRLCLSHEVSDVRVEHGLRRVAALLDHDPSEADLVL